MARPGEDCLSKTEACKYYGTESDALKSFKMHKNTQLTPADVLRNLTQISCWPSNKKHRKAAESLPSSLTKYYEIEFAILPQHLLKTSDLQHTVRY